MKEALIAIHDYCEWCLAARGLKDDGRERPDCGKHACALYRHRFGIVEEGRLMPPLDAIHGHCLQCLDGHEEEVRNCVAELGDASEGLEACSLWPWRCGQKARTTSSEQIHEGQKKKSGQAA